MIAVGVASPSAHGQAMTRTEMKIVSEKTSDSPAISHAAAASTAMTKTTGTKYPDTMSAILAIGAFDP